MAQVYKSMKTGEYGIYDDAGRFSWVGRDEAKDCLAAGATASYYCEDGEPMEDDDPLWDSLFHITGIAD